MSSFKSIMPVKKSQWRCIILIMMLILIYIFENYSPPFILQSNYFAYVYRPAVWIVFIIIALSFPKVLSHGKLRNKEFLIWSTGILSVVYILVTMIVGVIEGFGKSPYDHSLTGVITNIIIIFTALTGRELARNYIINTVSKKDYFITFIIIAVFMTVINCPVSIINGLKGRLDITKYIGQQLLPEFTQNLLAAYLVYLGGPILSIIYIGIQMCFTWFSPILPNLNWITSAMVNTIYPYFAFLFLQFIYLKNEKRNRNEREENPIGWIMTLVISILIVWFAVGVFPIRPFVIATGSMEPLIMPGDMVLVRRLKNPDLLKVGDIVQYKKEKIYIFHRIIKIRMDKQKKIGLVKRFQMKGDNNTIPDPDLVKPEDVKGNVIHVIPKIGWPSLLLKTDNVDRKTVQY